MITVFLVDDHETVREGLRLLVNAQPDMRVVSEAGDGASAVERACATRPNVIVLDLSMRQMSGLETAKKLRASLPSSAVVTLTRHSDQAYVQQLFAAGARAYVLKQSSSNELLKAIRTAATGETYVDPALRHDNMGWNVQQGAAAPAITDRETEVLRMVAVGHTNKDIGDKLNISVKTVEVHKANAMRKLRLAGRTDVVRYAGINGWLQDP
jgi:two-component system response regulator NreC